MRQWRSVVMEYGDVPPSFNETRHVHWRTASNHKKRWQSIFEGLLLEAHVPKNCAMIRVAAELRFPQKRRRDEGNFRTPIEKAFGDALTNVGVLSDDTPEHYRFLAVEMNPVSGPKLTTLYLSYSQE